MTKWVITQNTKQTKKGQIEKMRPCEHEWNTSDNNHTQAHCLPPVTYSFIQRHVGIKLKGH